MRARRLKPLQMRAAFEFVTGNDGEFGEDVQRAIAAHCILNRCSYGDVAPAARDWVRKIGKAHAKNFGPKAWFDLIRSGRPMPPRLTVLEGGAP